MRFLSTVCLLAAATACSPVTPRPLPAPQGVTAQAERALLGKVADTPQACISAREAANPLSLENGTGYRVSSSLIYVQRFNGQCSRSMLRNAYLVRQSTQTQLCRGDIASLNDRVSGFPLGSCVYADFVPYRTPK